MLAIIMARLVVIQPAFAYHQTFLWFGLFVIGLCLSNDQLGGVSPVIRSLGLGTSAYHSFLRMLHSSSIDVNKLVQCWASALQRMFVGSITQIGGRNVFLCDAIKISKEGQKMPGVKKMYQESKNNNKASYIRGHFFQVIGMCVSGMGTFFCIPFIGKIHEGFKLNKNDTRTLKDKFAELLLQFPLMQNGVLIGDCWYACQTIIMAIPQKWNLAFISRVARNAVAYNIPLPEWARGVKRGRKPKYGTKVLLMELFSLLPLACIKVPDHLGNIVEIKYWCKDLLWKPLGMLVRFVGCDHPVKGKIVLIATDINMRPEDIINGYILRFRIEVTFRVSIYTMGAFCYRLWMRSMEKLPQFPETQLLYTQSSKFIKRYLCKIQAYELHVMASFIAQGLLVYLSINFPSKVLGTLQSWFRTLRHLSVSETVVAESLRSSIKGITVEQVKDHALGNFLFIQKQKASCEKRNLPDTAKTG